MKASELSIILNKLTHDPEIVVGESWLPERLINTQLEDDFLFLQFDNAPYAEQGDEEGRGFVEHEIKMLRDRFKNILNEDTLPHEKADALLALFLIGHELSSSEVIEMLEDVSE